MITWDMSLGSNNRAIARPIAENVLSFEVEEAAGASPLSLGTSKRRQYG